MIIVVTRLKLRTWLRFVLFARHASRSMRQARLAPGRLFSDGWNEGRFFWTMTAWESWEAMRAYRNSGAHLQAMKAFRRVASAGRIATFEAGAVPDREEARRRLEAEGVDH